MVAVVGAGLYKEYTGHPDRTFFVLPLILVSLFMRQRGLARFKDATEQDKDAEQ